MRSALAALAAAALATPSSAFSVQVYVLMGQSNMLGEGQRFGPTTNGTLEYAVKTEGKYPYLWDSAKKDWRVRDDVRNVFVMGSGNSSFERSPIENNEWMTNDPTLNTRKTIGPELGIGNIVADATKKPTMILKSCIGNRALGWDLLPPGSPSYDYTDSTGKTYTYAGYHESPSKWAKGTTPVPVGWMAGEQYDGDVNHTHTILADLQTYYPGATAFEVTGFFWWQGDKDRYDTGLASRYELNLVHLIEALRKEFNAPKAKFVTASLGQTVKGSTANDGLILDAMLDVADATKYPQYKGNVAAVYSHPYSMGSSSSAHYGGNAETYMNIGQAMGEAMVGLLQ